jgi:ABC-2 type transport system ATP-binding protein
VETLRRGGTTVLLTTQYLDEADRLADRIAVIDRGTIVAEGTATELKARVGGDRLAVRVEDAEAASPVLAPLAEDGAAPVLRPGEVTIAVAGAQAAAEAVRLLDAAGIAMAGIELRQPTLDDVFLTLTGHAAEEAA